MFTVDSGFILASLPFALGIVMLGLGLGLTVADFQRVGQHPKAVVVAMLCQVVLLPVICLGLVLVLRLPAALAVGLLLVAASPGGPIANLYSHLFGGNVALNVTLTAVNSLLIVVTLPVVVNLAAGHFLSGGASVGLQIDKVIQVFVMVIAPVAVGMLVRALAPKVAHWLSRPVRVLSLLVLVSVVAVVLHAQREHLGEYFVEVGPAALVFNLVSLVVGYSVPRLVGVDHAASVAAGFEIGIHTPRSP